MKRKLPPFPALRAFEAAARRNSFKDAAQELCVTPSAISHQVRVLEEFLGKSLFRRNGGMCNLTEVGQQYLQKIAPLLDALDASTRQIAGETYDGPLHLKATEGFLNRWLIPRLPQFLEKYPSIDVQIASGLPPTEFQDGEIDIVIHWGDGPVPGAQVIPFLSSTRTPVCSPAYLAAHPDMVDPTKLKTKTLIRDKVADGWEEWFGLTGMSCPINGPEFAHCELTMTAAENGLGVALAYPTMISETLDRGALVTPYDLHSPTRVLYSIAYQTSRASDYKIIAFRDWLIERVEYDQLKINLLPGAAQ